MIIYNTTMNVSHEIHDEFISSLKNEIMPYVMSTGYFTDCKLFRLLNIDETDGPTYSMQFICDSMEKYQEFRQNIEDESRRNAEAKWGNHVYYYRSLMESVQ